MQKASNKHNQLFLSSFAKGIWAFAFFVFVLHQIVQKYGWLTIPWVDAWLDPFLFPIIVMPLLRWERQYATDVLGYRLSVLETLAMVLVLMLVSEIVLPWLSARFIYDPVDLICIAVGGLVYYVFMQ